MTLRKKILLVDDSSTVIMMEQMILKNEPYDIAVARDGEEGVAMAIAHQPDLILMDFVMPKLTGIEAVKKLRENASTREIPVIMVTTRGEAENIAAGYGSGCTDYVTKPINSRELITRIRRMLGVSETGGNP